MQNANMLSKSNLIRIFFLDNIMFHHKWALIIYQMMKWNYLKLVRQELYVTLDKSSNVEEKYNNYIYTYTYIHTHTHTHTHVRARTYTHVYCKRVKFIRFSKNVSYKNINSIIW